MAVMLKIHVQTAKALNGFLTAEKQFGLQEVSTYTGFQKRADAVKDGLVPSL